MKRSLSPAVIVAVLLAAFAASPAMAQVAAPDTAELVSFVESMWKPISAVIGAFTMVIIGVKGWKLVRRS